MAVSTRVLARLSNIFMVLEMFMAGECRMSFIGQLQNMLMS